MATLAEVRQQYPQYNDIDDATLAGKLHQKFYADIPRPEFDKRIGLAPSINFDRPVEAIRADIGALPEDSRKKAYDTWADHYVGKERANQGVARTAANAVDTFGRGSFIGPWLDEIDAAGNHAIHAISGGKLGVPYDEALALTRARSRAVDAANPVASTVGKLAGGLSGGVAAAASGPGIASTIVGGPLASMQLAGSMGGKIAQGAATGAVYGANSGFGNAEGDLGKRVEGAQEGAASGAVLGGALPPAIAGTGAVASKVGEAASPHLARVQQELRNLGIIKTPKPPTTLSAAAADGGGGPMQSGADAAAEQIIANQLSRANVNPRDLRVRMGQADEATNYHTNSRAQNVLAPVDLDPSLQRLAGSVGRQSPEAANTMQAFQYARQTGQTPNVPLAPGAGLPTRAALALPQKGDLPMGQGERSRDALKRALLIQDEDFHGHAANAYRTDQAILAANKAESTPAYAASYKAAAGIDLRPTLAPVMQKWEGQLIDEPEPIARALRTAMKLFERATVPAGSKSHLERADKVKQWLDDKIDKAFRGGDGYTGRVLVEFKNEVLDALDNVPKAGELYKKARGIFSSNMEAREKIEIGRKAWNDDSDVVADVFNKYRGDDGNVDKLVRLGLLSGFERKISRMKRSADVTQEFENPRIQEILQAVIPRSKSSKDVYSNRPERFGSYVGNEKSMIGTRNEVFGNSKTAQRLADDQSFETLSTVVEQFKQSPSVINIGMKAMETLLNRMFGMRADTAQAISQKLFTADPNERARLFLALEKRMGPSRAAELAQMMSQYQRQLTQAASTAGAGASGAQ